MADPRARVIVITPDSSGSRNASSAVPVNSGERYEPEYYCKRATAKGRTDGSEPCDAPRHRSSQVDEAVWEWMKRTINRGPEALSVLAEDRIRQLEAELVDFSAVIAIDQQIADLADQRARAFQAEIKYGTDASAEIELIDDELGHLRELKANRADDVDRAAGLRAQFIATEIVLDEFGGRFAVYGGGPMDEEGPEEALIAYAGRVQGEIPVVAAEIIERRKLVESLGLRIELDADQAMVTGMISAEISLGSERGNPSSVGSSPPAPRRRSSAAAGRASSAPAASSPTPVGPAA